MRQKIIALLLALAVLASVCAVSALAEEQPVPAEDAQAAQTETAEETSGETSEETSGETPEGSDPAEVSEETEEPPPRRGRTWRKT